MKSAILSLLPIAGLAIADSTCSLQTVTMTSYATVYETASVARVADVTSPAVADLTSTSTTCSRSTVTETTYEQVYVTVTATAADDVTTTMDVTSTSILHTTSTIHIRPSAGPNGNLSTTAVLTPLASSKIASSLTVSVLPTTQVSSSAAAPSSMIAVSSSENAAPVPSSSSIATVSPFESAAPAPSSSAAAVVTSESTSSTSTSAAASATSAITDSNTNSGKATFYGGNLSGGACSFTGYTIPKNLFGTALSDSNWDSSGNCGACVSVTGPSGNKITAMIVDECPGCGTNHLDLFPDAFAKLASPSTGVIDVSWNIVPCGITSPLVLKNKEGTSKFWFSMQVMNSNVPVAKLEVSTDGGNTWQATTRKDYNFFENASGFGTDTVDVKVTSQGGSAITVKNVSVAASSKVDASSNFSS